MTYHDSDLFDIDDIIYSELDSFYFRSLLLVT